MFPDPLPPDFSKLAGPPRPAEPRGPSTALAVLGLIYALGFGFVFFASDLLEGVAGGADSDAWTIVMWATFGPQVLVGTAVLFGGRHAPGWLRAAFLLATLATLVIGIATARGAGYAGQHATFMVLSTVIALIPQVIGWRR